MKKIVIVLVVVAVAAAVVWRVRDGRGSAPVNYRFVEIAQGDLASVVAATGTLEPVTTVQVGTQVSGILEQVMVDFNDRVRAGQVIARIDTTLMASAVASSRTQIQRAEADLLHNEREFKRLGALYAENMIAESEYNTAQYNLDVSRASLAAARIDLDRALRNLGYATITAPIDGIVVQRSVDPGQTVQASFSAPELFQIAGDLTRMQILVSVDESDIGQIVQDQAVRFTVQAYPDDTFTGEVRQVRLQSVIQENVVNYIAVVAVANPDGRLLPGMTATVDFIVEQATDVFHVPNAALRYKPDQAVIETVMARRQAERQARQAAGEAGPGGEAGGGRGQGGQAVRAVRAASARPAACPPTAACSGSWARTASSTPSWCAPASATAPTPRSAAATSTAGTQVIAGISSSAAQATGSPFQQQGQSAGGPPRPGGF